MRETEEVGTEPADSNDKVGGNDDADSNDEAEDNDEADGDEEVDGNGEADGDGEADNDNAVDDEAPVESPVPVARRSNSTDRAEDLAELSDTECVLATPWLIGYDLKQKNWGMSFPWGIQVLMPVN